MTSEKEKDAVSVAAALQEWRAAERTVAVARRGKLAAEAAATAAADAVRAAEATAEAARAAAKSAALAEESAEKTAAAARVIVQSTRLDLLDADAQVAMADVSEVEAHEGYRSASDRAAEREAERTAGG